MESSLRKEIWPFLLRVYPWSSTLEQRESIRNDNFLEYQNIRRKRLIKAITKTSPVFRQKKYNSHAKEHLESIENTIEKDVVRTDRKKPFYAGEDNPNMETLKYVRFRNKYRDNQEHPLELCSRLSGCGLYPRNVRSFVPSALHNEVQPIKLILHWIFLETNRMRIGASWV